MSYYTPKKGLVNRYWKRPKPRVYECNIRDSERFYQQSYKDYLEAKEYAAKRASEDRSRIGESSSWSIRRTNSVTDSESNNRSPYLNSSRNYLEDGHASTFRSTSVTGSRKSPDNDMMNIEDRLQRLQKLRSELGLPSSEISSGTTKVKFSLPSPTGSTTNLSTRRIASSPDPRERRGKTVDVSSTSSYSSTSGGSRSRATDFASDSYGDKLSSGTERSSKFASKYSSEEAYANKPEKSTRFANKYSSEDSYDSKPEKSTRFASKYSSEDSYDTKPKTNGYTPSYSKDEGQKQSYKSSFKSSKKYNDDDDSYSYKPKSRDFGESDSLKSSRKPPPLEVNDVEDYDDDAFLSNIKKKFPTSEEILERIKKMDSDM